MIKKLLSTFIMGLLTVAIMIFVMSYQKPYETRVMDATVKILIESFLGNGNGSGLHIGNGIILTAAHVVENEGNLKVRTLDGKELPATVIMMDKDHDFAFLKVEGKLDNYIPLTCEYPQFNQQIKMYGSPRNLDFTISVGYVSGTKELEMGRWKSVRVVNATTIPGISGGIVISDNKTVGIIVGSSVFNGQLVSYGVVVPTAVICNNI